MCANVPTEIIFVVKVFFEILPILVVPVKRGLQNIKIRCLQTMEKRLQMNICGIFLTVPMFTIMKVSPSAGKMVIASMLVNVPRLVNFRSRENIKETP